MSAQYPQVLEPQLDGILAGTTTEPNALTALLRMLLVIRRRYNDPFQNGTLHYFDGLGLLPDGSSRPDARNDLSPSSYAGCLSGFVFSNYWTLASQKARVEAGIAFLTPLVGAAVGNYPPIAYGPSAIGMSVDTMGNFIPAGMP